MGRRQRIVTEGQARKSLWIETCHDRRVRVFHFGQARKSLWIETEYYYA